MFVVLQAYKVLQGLNNCSTRSVLVMFILVQCSLKHCTGAVRFQQLMGSLYLLFGIFHWLVGYHGSSNVEHT